MSKEYDEGYEKGKLSIKSKGIGRYNPYLNDRPRREELVQFKEWNRGYNDAIAKPVVETKAKKTLVKKKTAKKKTKSKKVRKSTLKD